MLSRPRLGDTRCLNVGFQNALLGPHLTSDHEIALNIIRSTPAMFGQPWFGGAGLVQHDAARLEMSVLILDFTLS